MAFDFLIKKGVWEYSLRTGEYQHFFMISGGRRIPRTAQFIQEIDTCTVPLMMPTWDMVINPSVTGAIILANWNDLERLEDGV